MRNLPLVVAFAASIALAMFSTGASAHAPSGAIFTTLPDGSEVNFNIYAAKEDVYLDGGPGVGAPQTAAGLDDGEYVFMVTDPPGKKLLSTDAAKCRRFKVKDGIIDAVVVVQGGCEHVTGLDADHGAVTVQLMAYLDTPNPGGEYKAWATRVEDYVCSLEVVDCVVRGAKHGFIPSHSKTDNFKVRDPGDVVEIDTRFFNDANGNGHKDGNEDWLLGRAVTWKDTHGATNKKWSYYAPALQVNHEAHVEAPETGIHTITIANQDGCAVGQVHVDGVDLKAGPQAVKVEIRRQDRNRTVFIDVACTP